MSLIKDISHHTIVKYDDTCANQVQIRKLKNGNCLLYIIKRDILFIMIQVKL